MTKASAKMNDSNPQVSAGLGPGTSAWLTCAACGHWQRESSVCTYCQWSRLLHVEAATAHDMIRLRVLIETEFRSDGSWHLVGLRTARLPNFIEHEDLRTRLANAGMQILRIDDSGRKAGHQLPTIREWENFHDHSSSVLTEELNTVIRRNWPAPQLPKHAAVLVSIRTYLLDPEATADHLEPAEWLQIIPFDTAAANRAMNIDSQYIVVECLNTRIAFTGSRGMHIEATITSPSELLVDRCEVKSHLNGGQSRSLWSGEVKRVVRRNERTALPSIALSADAVRGLAPDTRERPRAEFNVFVLGKDDAISTNIPSVVLPSMDRIADLLLDLGSTNTKWALRHANGIVNGHDQDTLSLAEDWGVEPYRKADFIKDPSGELWGTWISRALPALRFWVGREHKAYLRNVYVSLPNTHEFDVESIAQCSSTDADQSVVNQTMNTTLVDAFHYHLVEAGIVVLKPEHRLLAAHYLTVLKILSDAARSYSDRYSSVEEQRRQQNNRRTNWERKSDALRQYKEKFFLERWWISVFGDAPTGPSGSKPSVMQSIADPAEWMYDLIAHPEQLERVVLLDAGGLSLDISVLENSSLLENLCNSDSKCGGEEISRRIGKNEIGLKGTRYKAMLGKRWSDSPDREQGYADQREYRDVTQLVYEPSLKPFFKNLAKQWRRVHYLTVLLTGGGSMNPHFVKLVAELAASNGFEVKVVHARMVQALISEAEQFPQPLPELDSPPIRRFKETQRWSEIRERQASARYDKFAVVGGMCALVEGDLV